METMFDSVVVSHIPKNAAYAAGYVNGIWPTFDMLRKQCPDAVLVSITINDSDVADVIDVEKGDVQPAQSLPWVRKMRSLGRTPIVYCSRSNMPAVQQVFAEANEPEPFFWIADYTGAPHLVPGSVATQWADGTSTYPGLAEGCDTSVVSPNFPIKHKNVATELVDKFHVLPKAPTTRKVVPMKFTTEALGSILRQLAAYAGIATQIANQGHLPTALRTAIVAASGILLSVEHYAAKP